MTKLIKVAVLGATGYVGIELVKILINHPNVKINFLGCDNILNQNIKNINLPNYSLNKDFQPCDSDVVFLALPHGISHTYVKRYFKKIMIIDLSADFRLDSLEIYKNNYDNSHSCPDILNEFIYGLFEINKEKLYNYKNIAVPGCYPTSILLPLIPIIKNNLIDTHNIIIDSKSGYSGAGKKFDLKNIKNSNDLNFYNYNTNNHRHICEIQQELNKCTKEKVNFSFNPHILPNYRGMMSTIYCDLKTNITKKDIISVLKNYYEKTFFIKIIDDEQRPDFFLIQNTNNCFIKIFDHHSNNRIIIVSIIDNLLKGAAGQAIQCFNHFFHFNESLALDIIE